MNRRIAVIGLGYVGLPLAVEFGKKYPTVGFDINKARVAELSQGIDRTLETTSQDLEAAVHLEFTTESEGIRSCDFFIVSVPTPVDAHNHPDLTPVIKASESVAKVLKKGDIVVYESTVYPGCTEEDCVPVLERVSGLVYNKDFFVGYSPERINPGDKEHTLTKIRKITSGSTPETALLVDEVYRSIIVAGTYSAASIKVAEAAKVIENTQRDINIAFVNELAKIFNLMGIDTLEVLQAAGTKWNFLNFRPGLVGGHCIGVDPFYLAQKAQSVGYYPEMILAGRRMNDSMGPYVANQVVKLMIKSGRKIEGARVLVLGMTFKENCPDIRNSRVIDIVRELGAFSCKVDVYDPHADKDEVSHEYGISLVPAPKGPYDSVIVAVSHEEFKSMDISALVGNGVIYDVKGVLPKDKVSGRL